MENRSKFFFRSLLPTLIVFGLQILVSFVVTEMFIGIEAYHFTGNTIEEFLEILMGKESLVEINQWTYLFYSLTGMSLFFAWYYWCFYKKDSTHFEKVSVLQPGRELSFSFKNYKLFLLIPGVVLLAAGLQFLSQYIMTIAAVIEPDALEQLSELEELSGIVGENVSPIVIFYVVVLGPICEELAFRGVTMECAKRTMGFWSANVIQAVLFAGMHMNMVQASYAFVFGLAFGYIYHKTGNIWLPVIMHILFNGFAMFMGELTPTISNPAIFFAILLGGMVACYGGIILIRRSVPEEKNAADANL